MRITYYVAASLDGFIANEDGDVSWLDSLGIPMSETGYDEFYAGIDGILMGRKTYDFIVGYGEWPYGDKPTWICSTNRVVPIEGCNLQPAHNLPAAYKEAEEKELNNLWCVGGGALAASLIEDKQLTHIYLSVMPILLGGGIRLFGVGDFPSQVKLKKANEIVTTQVWYRLNTQLIIRVF